MKKPYTKPANEKIKQRLLQYHTPTRRQTIQTQQHQSLPIQKIIKIYKYHDIDIPPTTNKMPQHGKTTKTYPPTNKYKKQYSPPDQKMKAIITFIASSGLRRSDVANLNTTRLHRRLQGIPQQQLQNTRRTTKHTRHRKKRNRTHMEHHRPKNRNTTHHLQQQRKHILHRRTTTRKKQTRTPNTRGYHLRNTSQHNNTKLPKNQQPTTIRNQRRQSILPPTRTQKILCHHVNNS